MAKSLLCYYTNPRDRIQIVRITNISSWYFERVVFSGQRLMFEAPSEAQLEIYSSAVVTAIPCDRIRCFPHKLDSN
ncbi:MAG TPA: DUF1830 domain-containing protein [Oscillatoriales cyanobacterium M59_W2019_021]|nr:MAG: DUF1830 domain-containing protein [Cyanobacteria bacterium J055]HIK31268.1 DUF1830 domain-containing protein [Oscillatoriales cyanobacterium M4454_W2019_049]HIK51884.1 DUF1830 domain-containing protein [Oscillatoriales cyanobacterium M59_W2019_021]